MYESHVAGKPRLSGARAALEALGVPEAERQAVIYAENKQNRLEELIHAGSVAAFPDALRFVQAIDTLGWPMAVASSSKNANQMMRQIHVDTGRSSRYLQRQRMRSRFAAGQAELGNFPARRRGNAKRPPTASWSRMRPQASRRPVRVA